ncbi:MAG TPA: cardiolipin synthase [Sediminispirochaeta sp.]|nr:cardiolipin synthase [Sediminispirochaeta sp.]
MLAGFVDLGSLLIFLYFAFVAIITFQIILDNKPPEVAVAWLLAIFFLPYLGAGLYLLSGVNWKKRKIMKQLPERTFKNHLGPILERQRGFLQGADNRVDNDLVKTISLALQAGNSILTLNNEARVYYSGAEFFDHLSRDIEAAEDSIHLEFFIYRSDDLGLRLRSLLLKKAEQGVKVRMIFDGVGCFNKMSKKFKRELKESKIEVRYFLDPMNVFSGRLLNYRNHRKIAVIDGKIAYTGGMNIGNEYIDGGRKFKSWRDTQLRLEGEAAQLLQSVFLSDWYNSGGELIQEERFFPQAPRRGFYLPMQVVVSGPDSDWNSIKKLFLHLISNANAQVFIQSPYFIPDESVVNALETAALSGVEVNLMMTGVADKRIPFWVAHTYFESLLKAGVKIYLYSAGFLHAKVLVVDQGLCTVGSCNMDTRSFHLDYEVNAFIYNEDIAGNLIDQFNRDVAKCRQVSFEYIYSFPLWKRLRNSVFRMIAPVL